eukprot:3496056-Ditylum_brightwellii.AAC.1
MEVVDAIVIVAETVDATEGKTPGDSSNFFTAEPVDQTGTMQAQTAKIQHRDTFSMPLSPTCRVAAPANCTCDR